jgi:predicted small lipoprotein YifL
MRAVFLLIVMTALLAGCGQKGPLYKASDRPESAQPLGGDRLDDDTDNEDTAKDDDQE